MKVHGRARAPSQALAALAVATGLVLSGCGGSGGGTFEAVPNLGISTDDSDYGPMLFDERGQAIYLFDRETSGTPACYDDCAAEWPPVLTQGTPGAGGGVSARLLGTTERDDGSVQVTYNGHPLYFYADEGPGQVLCHDVDHYGGTWLVVTPEGDAAPA
jgi:predicted lipoprotein with Yx(FWY)xxD motif